MKNIIGSFGLFGALLLASPHQLLAQVETPAYSNAVVVSIDPAQRVVVLRNARGRTETMVFDDLLESVGPVKAGDRVLVTVLGGPGRRRLSAISKARPLAPPTAAATPTRTAFTAAQRAEVRTRFSTRVAAVSLDAQSVDAAWASFVTACAAKLPQNNGGGRDWFGLWDGRVQADYSSGSCRDLFNQIVSSGEGIKKAMASAETEAQGLLEPGEIRDIRRLHHMNWDGWTLAPPARRDP